MSRPELELCAYSAAAVGLAERAGLDRVELCADPELGGTTPDDDVLRDARRNRDIEIWVMVRPRGGDFVYSDGEFREMLRTVAWARDLGADGVVLGVLTTSGDVDVARTRALVEAARPLGCTFHRAFDEARDWETALDDVIGTGCVRLLTSGQAKRAITGAGVIRKIVRRAAGRIEIMAGSGVNPLNGPTLIRTGVDALHFSAHRDGRFADPEFIEEMTKLI